MPSEAWGRVVVYLSPSGKPLHRAQQRILLEEDAKTIARLMGCEFAGYYRNELAGSGPLFFVPDQTLLLEEAETLGIRGVADLFGGIVPHPFVTTKSINHDLVSSSASRPDGWSEAYDEATSAYPGCVASRRNYDVGQGFDVEGGWRSGVFESSWRVGGASPAELLAISTFIEDPHLSILEALPL
jgi:hypothetical protein